MLPWTLCVLNRRCTGQLLTPVLHRIRATRTKWLLTRHVKGGRGQIMFTDEKMFSVQEKLKGKMTGCMPTVLKKPLRVERAHHPACVMVWCGVSYEGITQFHFCEQGVKMHAVNYKADILETVVKLLNSTLFAGRHWILQQDSVPAYKAKTTQRLLETNLPEFIAAEDWSSGSPELNPLYCR